MQESLKQHDRSWYRTHNLMISNHMLYHCTTESSMMLNLLSSINDTWMQNSRKDSNMYKLRAFVPGLTILCECKQSLLPKCHSCKDCCLLMSCTLCHSEVNEPKAAPVGNTVNTKKASSQIERGKEESWGHICIIKYAHVTRSSGICLAHTGVLCVAHPSVS